KGGQSREVMTAGIEGVPEAIRILKLRGIDGGREVATLVCRVLLADPPGKLVWNAEREGRAQAARHDAWAVRAGRTAIRTAAAPATRSAAAPATRSATAVRTASLARVHARPGVRRGACIRRRPRGTAVGGRARAPASRGPRSRTAPCDDSPDETCHEERRRAH